MQNPDAFFVLDDAGLVVNGFTMYVMTRSSVYSFWLSFSLPLPYMLLEEVRLMVCGTPFRAHQCKVESELLVVRLYFALLHFTSRYDIDMSNEKMLYQIVLQPKH